MKLELNEEQLQKLKDEILRFTDSMAAQGLEFMVGVQTTNSVHQTMFTTNMKERTLAIHMKTVIEQILPNGSRQYPESVLIPDFKSNHNKN